MPVVEIGRPIPAPTSAAAVITSSSVVEAGRLTPASTSALDSSTPFVEAGRSTPKIIL